MNQISPNFYTDTKVLPPQQPTSGPGGSDYLYDEIQMTDYAKSRKGFWLFEPKDTTLDSAHVVVFMHGYGAINPMVYGKWILHLVKKGNIVIFPRYQKRIFPIRSRTFVKNAVIGIQSALDTLKNSDKHLQPIISHINYVGHSYGGAISANIAANYEAYGLPKPTGMLLSCPGTGPLKGALLDSYEHIPTDMKLLMMVSEYDYVVGEKLALKIWDDTHHMEHRYLFKQYQDTSYHPIITANHNEAYSIDKRLDFGIHNMTTKRAEQVSRLNAVDFYGNWKLLDALNECTRNGKYCDYILNKSEKSQFMGIWSNGKPVKTLKII